MTIHEACMIAWTVYLGLYLWYFLPVIEVNVAFERLRLERERKESKGG